MLFQYLRKISINYLSFTKWSLVIDSVSFKAMSSSSSPSSSFVDLSIVDNVSSEQGYLSSYYIDEEAKKKNKNNSSEIDDKYIAPKITLSTSYLNESIKKKFFQQLIQSRILGNKDEYRLFFGLDSDMPYHIVLTSLGNKTSNDFLKGEAARRAVSIQTLL